MITFEHYKKVDELAKRAIDEGDTDTLEYVEDVLAFMIGYLAEHPVEWEKVGTYIHNEAMSVLEELEG